MCIKIPKKIIRAILILVLIMLLPCSIIYHYCRQHRSEQPVNTRVANGVLPIHFWKTTNGAAVYFVPTEHKPVVDIQVTFNAGSSRDNGKLGLSYLVSQGVIEGTNARTLGQILGCFDSTEALYSANVDLDRAIFKLRILNDLKKLRSSVDLLAEILSTPTFPKLSIDRLKNKLLIALNVDLETEGSEYILKSEFYKLLYNKHPYANQELGDGNLDHINVEDLINFHNTYYVANNCVITIVGNIHRDQARDLSNLITSTMKSGNSAALLPKVDQTPRELVKKVSFADANRSSVMLGQIISTSYNSDYINLIVGNAILGNSIYSRLTKNIQEKDRLAYNISSDLLTFSKPGPFFLKFYTKKELTDKAINSVKLLLTDFINNGPTDEEVELIKHHLINSWPMQFTTNEAILDRVSYMGFYQLPFDFFDSYIETLSSVTKGSILKVWQQQVHPHFMATVIVG